MTIKKVVIGAALVIIGLPLLLILTILLSVSLANKTNGAIVSSGEKREYLLYVPKSYDRAKPTPLVISMHAAMNWPAYQMKISQWNNAADENGFIVVYPAGTGTGMAFALSCTLSNRIAAIGAVSAAQALSWSWCADSTPMPMIAFHGTADPFVPYNGAPTGWLNPTAPFPNVVTWAASWARRNHCGPRPVDSAVAAGVTRREYTNCAENAAVVLYTIRGGGHQWPGGKPIPEWIVGPMSREIDATGLMWEFFREHPLRTTQSAARQKL